MKILSFSSLKPGFRLGVSVLKTDRHFFAMAKNMKPSGFASYRASGASWSPWSLHTAKAVLHFLAWQWSIDSQYEAASLRFAMKHSAFASYDEKNQKWEFYGCAFTSVSSGRYCPQNSEIGPNSEIFCRFCRPPGETSDFLWYSYPDWSIEIMNTRLFMPFSGGVLIPFAVRFFIMGNRNHPQKAPYCNWLGYLHPKFDFIVWKCEPKVKSTSTIVTNRGDVCGVFSNFQGG